MNKKLINTCDLREAIVEELSGEDSALIRGGDGYPSGQYIWYWPQELGGFPAPNEPVPSSNSGLLA